MGDTLGYSKDEVMNQLNSLRNLVLNLDNGILQNNSVPASEDKMGTRIKEKVVVNGKVKWIDGYSRQNAMDNYVRLLQKEGVVETVDEDSDIPLFGEYFRLFYDTYKQGQQSNTVVNRERIARNHILPEFGNKRIDKISTMELQRWFTELGKKYSRETALKIRNTMNPVFDAAVEEELITRNPLASRRLVISGKECVPHKAIPKNLMDNLKAGLHDLPDKERWMGGLLCYTGMRFEEVLGIRWEDITDDWITVKRAVVHPSRNAPEVKCPKTKTSKRKIPMTNELKELLKGGAKKGFVLASNKDKKLETPLSYTEARYLLGKIRKKFGIEEYSAHDFRDTCATEWRENGMPLDTIARLLGHSKTETTEKRYVKYRDEGVLDKARDLM